MNSSSSIRSAASIRPNCSALQFDHFWLQPMDGPDRAANTAAAIDYCLVASELAIERADAQARWNSIILEHDAGNQQAVPFRIRAHAASRRRRRRAKRASAFTAIPIAPRWWCAAKPIRIPAWSSISACWSAPSRQARSASTITSSMKCPDLGPATMENLSIWIWRKVAADCTGLSRVTVYRDSTGEMCSYFGPNTASIGKLNRQSVRDLMRQTWAFDFDLPPRGAHADDKAREHVDQRDRHQQEERRRRRPAAPAEIRPA